MALVNKYVDIPELTQAMVSEFVQKIIVCTPFDSDGHHVQHIGIIFNFVGEINIPMFNDPVTATPSTKEKKPA